jgi:hypothetical protein
MASFKPYVLRVAVLALLVTAVCLLIDPAWRWLLSFEPVGFIPKALAITLGGVHSPSFLGLFLGVFLELFVVGMLGAVPFWLQNNRGAKNAT